MCLYFSLVWRFSMAVGWKVNYPWCVGSGWKSGITQNECEYVIIVDSVGQRAYIHAASCNQNVLFKPGSKWEKGECFD